MDEVTRLALEQAWRDGYEKGFDDGRVYEYEPYGNPYSWKKDS